MFVFEKAMGVHFSNPKRCSFSFIFLTKLVDIEQWLYIELHLYVCNSHIEQNLYFNSPKACSFKLSFSKTCVLQLTYWRCSK